MAIPYICKNQLYENNKITCCFVCSKYTHKVTEFVNGEPTSVIITEFEYYE